VKFLFGVDLEFHRSVKEFGIVNYLESKLFIPEWINRFPAYSGSTLIIFI